MFWKSINTLVVASMFDSIDFLAQDNTWQTTNCNGGSPDSDRSGSEKFFEPTSGFVVTGWIIEVFKDNEDLFVI